MMLCAPFVWAQKVAAAVVAVAAVADMVVAAYFVAAAAAAAARIAVLREFDCVHFDASKKLVVIHESLDNLVAPFLDLVHCHPVNPSNHCFPILCHLQPVHESIMSAAAAAAAVEIRMRSS